MAKKSTPKATKAKSKPPAEKPTPDQIWEEVVGCVEMTPGNLDELNVRRGSVFVAGSDLEVHVSGFGTGVAFAERLEAVGVSLRHTVYEKGASVWVCLFVELSTLPSRRS